MIAINLAPEFVLRRNLGRLRLRRLMLAAFSLFSVSGVAALGFGVANHLQSQNSSERYRLEQEVGELRAAIKASRGSRTEGGNKAPHAAYASSPVEQSFVAEVMRIVGASMPNHASLSAITINDSTFELQGVARDGGVVSELLSSINSRCQSLSPSIERLQRVNIGRFELEEFLVRVEVSALTKRRSELCE